MWQNRRAASVTKTLASSIRRQVQDGQVQDGQVADALLDPRDVNAGNGARLGEVGLGQAVLLRSSLIGFPSLVRWGAALSFGKGPSRAGGVNPLAHMRRKR